MPVDSVHPDFERTAPRWKRIRDVLDGEDAIKDAGTTYLPRLSEQTDQQFHAYRSRAQFFNATARTWQSLQGLIFRKDPVVEIPESMGPFMQDVTMDGADWYDYTKRVVREVLATGRYGTLIDWAEHEQRPYFIGYAAEDIRNWKVERVGGRMMLTLLVLYECTPGESRQAYPASIAGDMAQAEVVRIASQNVSQTGDRFEHGHQEQWRVYYVRLDGDGLPLVQCEIWQKRMITDGKPEWVMVNAVIPSRRIQALGEIPFVFHGITGSGTIVDKIPLEDMALVNLSLYRTSADLENGRHFTGLPTPWAAGFEATGGVLRLGSSEAWVSESENAKCGFLEFTGAGLSALEKAVQDKKSEMVALGARMLEPEAKKAEAYDTVAMRSAAESSALMNATVSCTQSLSQCLQWAAWWSGTAPDRRDLSEIAKTELNTEFTVMTLQPDVLTALTAAYLGGALDWNSYFWKLQQGEMIPPGADPAQVLASIQNSPPPGIPQPEPAPVPGA